MLDEIILREKTNDYERYEVNNLKMSALLDYIIYYYIIILFVKISIFLQKRNFSQESSQPLDVKITMDNLC